MTTREPETQAPPEPPPVGQCGVCCALVPEPCLAHHEEWHRTLTNTDTKEHADG